jgi:hypothetical protein
LVTDISEFPCCPETSGTSLPVTRRIIPDGQRARPVHCKTVTVLL